MQVRREGCKQGGAEEEEEEGGLGATGVSRVTDSPANQLTATHSTRSCSECEHW